MPADTGPSKGILSKIFGRKKKGDIELPNESGIRDKRLPKPSIKDAIKEMKSINPFNRAADVLKSAREKSEKNKKRR